MVYHLVYFVCPLQVKAEAKAGLLQAPFVLCPLKIRNVLSFRFSARGINYLQFSAWCESLICFLWQ